MTNGRVVGPALVLLLAACTRVGDPARPPGSDGGDGAPPTATTGASVSGASPGSEVLDPAEPGLYRIDPVTGEIERLLSSGEDGLHEPELSPDGRQLVFQGSAPDGTPQIFVRERGETRQLTHLPGGALEPSWSPDGSQIAFAGRSRADDEVGSHIWALGEASVGDTDIFVMDADGKDMRRLVGTPRPDRRPDWSPDGSRIVFDTAAYVLVVPVVGDERARRLNPAIRVNHGPAADATWSPDGRWIAFTRFAPSSINGRIGFGTLWLMRPDGTSEHRVFPTRTPEGTYELDPSWSPDGSSIAFSSGSDSRIAIVDTGSGEIVVLDSVTGASDLSWDRWGILVSMGSLAGPSPDPF